MRKADNNIITDYCWVVNRDMHSNRQKKSRAAAKKIQNVQASYIKQLSKQRDK